MVKEIKHFLFVIFLISGIFCTSWCNSAFADNLNLTLKLIEATVGTEDSGTERIVITLQGNKVHYQWNYKGWRPKEYANAPTSTQKKFSLTEEQQEAVITLLSEKGLYQSRTVLAKKVGKGKYVDLSLTLKSESGNFGAHITGMAWRLDNEARTGNLDEATLAHYEAIRELVTYIESILP